jgi:large subunit ribosomal protein L6
MSRVAKSPVTIPAGVEVNLDGNSISLKGKNGSLSLDLHSKVAVEKVEDQLTFNSVNNAKDGWAFAGTMRALVNNMVVGVHTGFERKLQLVGVGYRAKSEGSNLNLTLGFSHPVNYAVPEGISIETPSQTEIVVKGANKQLVGQVAADIRAYRPPEPYKGKGVRYADEHIRRKETKKK